MRSKSILTEAKQIERAVTLINLGTSERRTVETDALGNYQFVNLVPGPYRIEIQRVGFKRLTRDQIQVEVQAVVRIDATLEVGDVGQVVEVKAETPLLQTETSSLGQVVESRAVQQMPLNGRNVLNLVALVPGVVPQGQSMGNPTKSDRFSKFRGNPATPDSAGHTYQSLLLSCEHSVVSHLIYALCATEHFTLY